MKVPTVHMNGTSRDELVEQLCKVSRQFNNLMAALLDAAPNGRDYYPQGDNALRDAQEERRADLKALDAMAKRYEALAETIADLPGGRR